MILQEQEYQYNEILDAILQIIDNRPLIEKLRLESLPTYVEKIDHILVLAKQCSIADLQKKIIFWLFKNKLFDSILKFNSPHTVSTLYKQDGIKGHKIIYQYYFQNHMYPEAVAQAKLIANFVFTQQNMNMLSSKEQIEALAPTDRVLFLSYAISSSELLLKSPDLTPQKKLELQQDILLQ